MYSWNIICLELKYRLLKTALAFFKFLYNIFGRIFSYFLYRTSSAADDLIKALSERFNK